MLYYRYNEIEIQATLMTINYQNYTLDVFNYTNKIPTINCDINENMPFRTY